MADRTRQILSFIAKAAITIAILWLVGDRLGWSNIVSTVSRTDWRWFTLALVVFIVSSVLGVVQWKMLLDNRGMHIPFSRAFVLYFVGILFNNIMLGMVAGDAIKIALLKKESGKGSGRLSLAATFLDRVAGLWAMMAFAMVGSLILFHHGLNAISGRMETAGISLIVTFAAFCLLCMLIVSRRMQSMAFAVLDKIPLPQKDKIRSIVSELFLEVADRKILLPIISLSTLIQTLRIAVHVLCAAALGMLTMDNFQYFFVFVPMIAILMLIPLPFGVREVMAGGLFVMAGFQSEGSVVMQFLVSLVGLVTSAFSGVLFLANHFRVDRKEMNGSV